MFRFKVTGHMRDLNKTITVTVTAANRDDAVNMAFDDMGLVCIWSVRKGAKAPV